MKSAEFVIFLTPVLIILLRLKNWELIPNLSQMIRGSSTNPVNCNDDTCSHTVPLNSHSESIIVVTITVINTIGSSSVNYSLGKDVDQKVV